MKKGNYTFLFALLLSLVFVLYVALTWGKWGNLYYDCFRELYIPIQMLKGKLLYKDIPILYPALGYQINALLFKIFGSSLNTLYMMGILTSFGILALLFSMLKKHTNIYISSLIIFSIMCINTFGLNPDWSNNWFFCYSYSLLYSYFFFILSVFFLEKYYRNKNYKFLILSALIFGISYAIKLDFMFFLFLLALIIFDSDKNLKTKSLTFSLIFLPMVISYLILIKQGISLTFLIDCLKSSSSFLFTKSMTDFLSLCNPLFLTFDRTIDIVKNSFQLIKSIIFISCTILPFFIFYEFLNNKNKILNTKTNKTIFYIVLLLLSLGVSYFIFKKSILINYADDFCGIFWILIFLLIYQAFNKEKDTFFSLLIISSIIALMRSYPYANFKYVCNIIMSIAIATILYFLFEIVPKNFNIKFKKIYVILLTYIVTTYSLAFLYNNISTSQTLEQKIDSPNGYFYVKKEETYINDLINYLKFNLKKDDTILGLPELLFLNYYTDSTTAIKYHTILVHMIESYGESNIINELNTNPPTYIVINQSSYLNKGIFGQDYGINIKKYILKNYDENKKILNGNKTKFIIYKLKH